MISSDTRQGSSQASGVFRTGGAGPSTDRSQAWPIVAAREVVVKLTDRNFLVSTLTTLLIIVGALAFQGMMAGRESSSTIAVSDGDGVRIVQQASVLDDSRGGSLTLVPMRVADEAAARNAVSGDSAEAYLHRTADGWALTGKGSPDGAAATAIEQVVRSEALTRNATAAGTTVEAMQRGASLAVNQLDTQEDPTAGIVRLLAGLVFAMLFYIASLLFGMAIAQSVVEEKQSRIVEILATAIPLRQLLIGKVVGNTLLALAQMVLFVAAAFIGISFTEYQKYVPSLSGPLVWYLAFFVAGFVTLACVWAVAGSLASRVEDLQSTTMPLTMVLVVALFAGLAAKGVALVAVSYVPLLSTITMPLRLLAGEAAWWEPVVSLAVTLAAAFVIIRVAEKIYRRSLLQSQGRMTVRQALRTQD